MNRHLPRNSVAAMFYLCSTCLPKEEVPGVRPESPGVEPQQCHLLANFGRAAVLLGASVSSSVPRDKNSARNGLLKVQTNGAQCGAGCFTEAECSDLALGLWKKNTHVQKTALLLTSWLILQVFEHRPASVSSAFKWANIPTPSCSDSED